MSPLKKYFKPEKNSLRKILYCLQPLVAYLFVSFCAAAAMELAWEYVLQERVTLGAEPAYAYAARTVWAHLCIVVPAGAGALAVRREAAEELEVFSRRFRGRAESVLKRTGFRRIMLLLPVPVTALSLGINVCFSMALPRVAAAEGGLSGTLPGPAGFLLPAVVYGLYMPFLEELLFRGIVFSRLERGYGLRAAIPLSAVLFGLYHLSLAQGIYAAAMGAVFAAAYAAAGHLAAPVLLHGVCNLMVLLLGRTGLYTSICTPPWAAMFFGTAMAGFYTIYRISHR